MGYAFNATDERAILSHCDAIVEGSSDVASSKRSSFFSPGRDSTKSGFGFGWDSEATWLGLLRRLRELISGRCGLLSYEPAPLIVGGCQDCDISGCCERREWLGDDARCGTVVAAPSAELGELSGALTGPSGENTKSSFGLSAFLRARWARSCGASNPGGVLGLRPFPCGADSTLRSGN